MTGYRTYQTHLLVKGKMLKSKQHNNEITESAQNTIQDYLLTH